MKYGVEYKDLNTLAELNSQLKEYGLEEMQGSSFTLATAAQTTSDIDTAIENSDLFIYETIEASEIVEAVNTALRVLAEPPDGYKLYENAKVFAYIRGDGGFSELNKDDLNLLVDAANKLGNKTHQSSEMQGNYGEADAYTHNEATNRLFSFKRNGDHTDGVPKVTVVKQGNVSSGKHRF